MNKHRIIDLLLILPAWCSVAACNSELQVSTKTLEQSEGQPAPNEPGEDEKESTNESKFSSRNDDTSQKPLAGKPEPCLDPDLNLVPKAVEFTLCNGETAQGKLDLTNLVPENIRRGITVAGVTGEVTSESHEDCALDGAVGCVTTESFTAADTGSFTASDILSGKTVAGVIGSAISESHASCISDGEPNCVVDGSSYRAAKLSNFTAADIKTGVTIAGFNGTATLEQHSPCSADGISGCITTPSFLSAAMANVDPGNIRFGVVVAGVTGTYPSAASRLAGNSVTPDLTSLSSAVAAGTYEFWDSAGVKYTGTISDAGTISPTTSNQLFNTSLYRQFTVLGDTDLVAGNIKNGVEVFGTNGAYPSATYPLPGAGSTPDLDSSTFPLRIKSGGSFEYWTESGIRHTGYGDPDINEINISAGVEVFGTVGSLNGGSPCSSDGEVGCITTTQYRAVDTNPLTPWDIRQGKSVGGIHGDLKFCKSGINHGIFNNSSAPAGSGLDFWDTIDDYSDNGAYPGSNGFLATDGGVCNAGNWQDLTPDGLCDSSGDECIYRDLVTDLIWTEAKGNFNWQNAINHCDTLVFAGYSDWRLPTQKELMQAYTDGIRSIESTNFGDVDQYYWSSTTFSETTNRAWAMDLGRGDMSFSCGLYGFSTRGMTKTTSYQTFCVRDNL